MVSSWLHPLPLVAILRGIGPDEAVSIGHVLADAGFRVLEVPLNSPQPMESIHRLTQSLGDNYLIGAGTVMTTTQVQEVAAAGGRLIVMPHADTVVIRAAKDAGMVCVPGVATPTEAFAALAAGADGLKLFPADQLSPAALKAWRAVLPKELPVLPVGGIAPDNMAPWVAAGAHGFGIGSALYAPGLDADEVAHRAHAFAQAWAAVSPKSKEHRA
ncbi:2-dehydro-3-deoxy-6-phosphogalactonate aldolase [Rhodanobacter sp. C01]|uniref:2-dehydro-3-deoxy-6-phosphogalactonate aldolase n=1 Tax=Rhodanobacter sp. C01 TaxID=1945856 RepID=UPI0009862A96|nr:2-dehydro-3-deoxy-6-phosphogalactonate aldolase [Rhodanobacter sp. C01]OOG45445.1 2-dehydro-3-deoxy-6-phosphogalactonate aldolase [Rhodanobacter sp. C01]